MNVTSIDPSLYTDGNWNLSHWFHASSTKDLYLIESNCLNNVPIWHQFSVWQLIYRPLSLVIMSLMLFL